MLSISSYSLPTDPSSLDLKWALDEKEFLNANLTKLWKLFFNKNNSSNRFLNQMANYPVYDPYGSERAYIVLSNHFNVELKPSNIFFGAGVLSLLSHLSIFAQNSCVLTRDYSYPDFLVWISKKNAQVISLAWNTTIKDFINIISEAKPSVIFFEQPSIFGISFSHKEIKELCYIAKQNNALVIIDESNTNYLDNSFSLVPLATTIKNLVILKGISKGYGFGGLRIGYIISHSQNNHSLKEIIPPLQVSEFSYLFALEILKNPNILDKLRKRIKIVKSEIVQRFQMHGFEPISPSNRLPWIVFWGDSTYFTIRETYNVEGKVQNFPQIYSNKIINFNKMKLTRVSLPLTEKRLKIFRELFPYAGLASK